jgi:hypothetical protein
MRHVNAPGQTAYWQKPSPSVPMLMEQEKKKISKDLIAARSPAEFHQVHDPTIAHPCRREARNFSGCDHCQDRLRLWESMPWHGVGTALAESLGLPEKKNRDDYMVILTSLIVHVYSFYLVVECLSENPISAAIRQGLPSALG